MTRLMPPFPNPANPSVTLRFTLARAGDAAVDVFDARGRHMRTMQAPGLAAGLHSLRVEWTPRSRRAGGVGVVPVPAARGWSQRDREIDTRSMSSPMQRCLV